VKPGLERLGTDVIVPRTCGHTGEARLTAGVVSRAGDSEETYKLRVHGEVEGHTVTSIDIFVDGTLVETLRSAGEKWETSFDYTPQRPECLGWDLKPLPPRKAMILVVVRAEGVQTMARLLWADYSGYCRS
jgi:hypothetical protein